MQACARIGATHSVVFGGFSAQSLRDRIKDAGAVMVITADEQCAAASAAAQEHRRRGSGLGGCESIKDVIVYKRTGGNIAWWHPAATSGCTSCWRASPPPASPSGSMPSTRCSCSTPRGSTGKPKGVQHSTGGYLLHAALTTKWTFDLKDDDVFWCTADIGWVTGHTYITYGPLAWAAPRSCSRACPPTRMPAASGR
jgi:acetyl-CoA synthetase